MDASRCRVGLFGVYSAMNFGDDLMAVIFGKYLQDLGVEFTVYDLPEEYAKYGFPVTRSLQDFVDSSDMIVYGGGGVLQPKRKEGFLGDTLDELLRLCRNQSRPIFCFSIGGRGLPLAEIIPPARGHLVKQAEYVTLRLRADIPLLAEAGTRGDHFEDVVWTTPSFYPPRTPGSGGSRRTRIGVNLYPHSALERRRLPRVFSLLAAARRDCDFVFIESMFGDESLYGEYQALRPPGMRGNCSYYKFRSVDDGIECVQGLDLMVTNRLHLGMVAMSYGIPSIALYPLPKTRLCYQELGLERFCWDGGKIWKVGQLFLPVLQRRLLRTFGRFDLETIRSSAMQHFRKLEEVIRECSLIK